MKFLAACTSAFALFLAGTLPAFAQAPADKAVRIIVPTGTGGTADVLARQVGLRLQTAWGRPVIVDNKTGAGGNIGAEMVAKAAPDGMTLGLLSNAMVVAQALGTKPRFDVEKDFTPIALLGQTPMAIVAHPRYGIKTMADLVAYAKANAGTVSYGSCGIGTPHHLVMELVKQTTGTDMKHAAYRGCSTALVDLLGDQVAVAIVSANLVVPHAKTGKLNVLAVSSADRYGPLPAVPTLEQQGAKVAVTNWFALMGPPGLTKAEVQRMQADVTRVLQDPAMRAALSDAGVEVLTGSGEELAKLIAADRTRYEQIANSAKIRLE